MPTYQVDWECGTPWGMIDADNAAEAIEQARVETMAATGEECAFLAEEVEE